MSEANKYGQGDNHTMEARIIRNPAFESLEPKPDSEAQKPCGECHLQNGERCDICGAAQPKPDAAGEGIPQDDSEVCECGHTRMSHVNFGRAECDECADCGCFQPNALSAPRNSALEEIGGFDKYWPVYGLRQADLNEDHSLEYIRSIANRFYKVGFHDSASDLRKSHRKLEDAAKEMAEREQKEAFVRGAKWWEFEKTGATMWQSDQNKAWEVAESRLRTNPSEGGDGYGNC